MRLVKSGDGLATTTSSGTKGARADQIADARDAFLQAIAREYGYAARDIAAFNEAAKNYSSNTIRKLMQPSNDGKFKDGIHDTMLADANRAIYTFNGTTYNHKPADELIPAFKALVPDPKKQRALSTYLNQLCFETIE